MLKSLCAEARNVRETILRRVAAVGCHTEEDSLPEAEAMREGRRGETTRPRIAPVLLWPVAVKPGTGVRGQARIAFD
jgi:hypothetical protein